MERATYYKIALVLGAAAVATGAFSWKSRNIIKERDQVCRLCGSSEHLEAAHINHNKQDPRYDDPSNGRLLCTEDHLKDHINRHGRNGLPKRTNERAIELIKQRLPTTIYKAEDSEEQT